MKTTTATMTSDAESLLRERFELQQFRPGQQRVIEALLAGRSAAAVFPTGGGKSLCYQLPALLLPGVTLVVSPLLALMKDQVDQLQQKGIRAGRLDSTLSPVEFRDCIQGVRDGAIKILYVAPERFFNERFRATIQQWNISLFAVDEAHCISQWGHNFRPDYLKLAEVARSLSADRILALTATATPPVLDDICEAFAIEPDDAVRTPFFRPNLHLASTITTETEREDCLLQRIQERPKGPTLVYVSLQKTAEAVAETLAEAGLPARAYHAGMKPEERAAIQQWFLDSTEGIVAATIAFGMGIDKPNIRYVYHYNPPRSLESYAQEIGRAGRDGAESHCEVMLVPEDRIVLDNFVYGDTPSLESVRRFVELMAGQPETFHISHYRLSADTDIRVLVLKTLLTYLELDGFLEGTSPRYDTFKFKPRVPSSVILEHFTGEKRDFVAGLLGASVKGRVWYWIDMIKAGQRLGCERERMVRALDYLAQQEWLEVQTADLVHGYKKRQPIESPKELAEDLQRRLTQRESTEIRRTDRVIDFAKASDCLADQLSTYFGEPLEVPCGVCSHCRGEGDHRLPPPKLLPIGTSARTGIESLARQHPDLLNSPRQKARVLCGLTSPAFTRARISREPVFGVCGQIPFADVMRQLAEPAPRR